MRAGITIGRAAGARVEVGWSWLFVMPVVGTALFASIGPTGSATDRVVAAVLGVALLLASVLLHEIGHALVAIRLGFAVERIAMFLLGGFSEMDLAQATPAQERAIVIAGPLVSSAAALTLWVAATILPVGDALHDVVVLLAVVNAGVAAFNLLPAYPLDGGRLIRAVLEGRGVERVQAERFAVRSGIVLGGLIVAVAFVASLLGSPLSLVALPVGVLLVGLGLAARTPSPRSPQSPPPPEPSTQTI